MSYVTSAIDLHDRMTDLVLDLAEWSQATFGSDRERGPVGPLKHLESEAREAVFEAEEWSKAATAGVGRSEAMEKAREGLKEEMADCLLLLLDATRRAGWKLGDIVDAAQAKMVVNRARKWPKPVDAFTPVEHLVEAQKESP